MRRDVCVRVLQHMQHMQLTQPHLNLIAVVWQDMRDILGVAEPDDGEWRHNSLVHGWIKPWLDLDQFVIMAIIREAFAVSTRVPATSRSAKHYLAPTVRDTESNCATKQTTPSILANVNSVKLATNSYVALVLNHWSSHYYRNAFRGHRSHTLPHRLCTNANDHFALIVNARRYSVVLYVLGKADRVAEDKCSAIKACKLRA